MNKIGTGSLAIGVVMLLQGIAALLLIGSVGINFANIIGRYFFHHSISWAEEIMLFMMIASVYLTSAVVGWAGDQIRMDAFVSALPPRPRLAMEVMADVVLVGITLFMAYLAWPVVSMLAEFDQRSQAADFPLVVPQAMMPIGFVLMAFLVLARLLNRHGSKPADTHTSAGH